MKKRSCKLKEGKNKQTLKLVRTKAVDDGPFLTKEEFHKQLNLLEINRLKALEKIEVNQSDVDPESINVRYRKEKIKLLKRFRLSYRTSKI
ncbi:hypothetical protein RirG_220350 [Rhizophagus irregularis DAOM 197198w]|uniref:Uncharacterized protein n=1 Tax=Rhizophagus irregularis (strain DAOM 197198w) TaxID=1432141 RepID=A0A015IFP0_RHIIW|nr:hypothetical protein RirG_220350 [Rhizophagus irregularis DAOM 197198w]